MIPIHRKHQNKSVSPDGVISGTGLLGAGLLALILFAVHCLPFAGTGMAAESQNFQNALNASDSENDNDFTLTGTDPDPERCEMDSITLQIHGIPSSEPGLKLSLREKHLAERADFRSNRVVLLLEPFGVPAAEAFDSSLPGYSLMDYLARRGYDVWALDFRGFGASDRPAAFNQPMMANSPQMRASEASHDVDSAMQYIASQRGISKANLLGWSWGAVVASEYAGKHPESIEKLVIYGGMHGFLLPSMTNPMTDPSTGAMKPLPAYQLALPSMSINHWNMQAMGIVPHTAAAEAELSRIFLASDPTNGTRSPASIRRAMGPMVDLYEIWSGRPVFDASLIKAPTLIIRGDHDTFSNDPGFMSSLINAPIKRYVELPQATHWALYEPTAAPLLMNEIHRFLSAGGHDS